MAARRVRLNEQIVGKTHQLVRPGDVITLTEPRAGARRAGPGARASAADPRSRRAVSTRSSRRRRLTPYLRRRRQVGDHVGPLLGLLQARETPSCSLARTPSGRRDSVLRVSAFQTSPSLPCWIIASEYLKPSTVPGGAAEHAAADDGPTRFVVLVDNVAGRAALEDLLAVGGIAGRERGRRRRAARASNRSNMP